MSRVQGESACAKYISIFDPLNFVFGTRDAMCIPRRVPTILRSHNFAPELSRIYISERFSQAA